MNIAKLYNDPKFPASFAGKDEFIKRVLERNDKLTKKFVAEKLKATDSYTLHKPQRKTKVYRRIYSRGIGHLYQADLVDMSKFADENDGYKFIINIIDVFSKRAWAFMLKNKTANSIYEVMEPFLAGNPCKKMEFDQGTEFYNKKFLDLLKRLKIEYFSVYSDRKCAVVERFNRTLKTRMYRSFTAQGSHRWVDNLQHFINGYNRGYS